MEDKNTFMAHVFIMTGKWLNGYIALDIRLLPTWLSELDTKYRGSLAV